MFGGLFLFVFLFDSACSQDSDCHLFNRYGRYKENSGAASLKQKLDELVPSGCQPLHINIVAREGIKYPPALGYIRRTFSLDILIKYLTFVHKELKGWKKQSRNKTLEQKIEAFKKSVINVKKNFKPGSLSEKGERDMYELAQG